MTTSRAKSEMLDTHSNFDGLECCANNNNSRLSSSSASLIGHRDKIVCKKEGTFTRISNFRAGANNNNAKWSTLGSA